MQWEHEPECLGPKCSGVLEGGKRASERVDRRCDERLLETVRLDFEPFAPAAEYVPGRLADRELPPYLALLRRCPRPLAPQCVFVDGNGVLHPERFGIACRLGVDAATPTIGVAKNLLRVDGVDARARSKRDRDAPLASCMAAVSRAASRARCCVRGWHAVVCEGAASADGGVAWRCDTL